MTCFALLPSETKLLRELANKITASSFVNTYLFVSQATNVSHLIPFQIKNILVNFVKNGSPKGFVLLSNLPLDSPIPKTPPSNQFLIGEKTMLAKIQAIINQFIGEMISYEAEGFGNLFQDMVPKKELKDTQTSLGSNVELEIHTEQAFSPLKPDILSLACLRGDPNAKTYIFHVNQIIRKLSHDKCELLRKPLWKIGIDLSFLAYHSDFINGNIRGPIPILYGNNEDPYLIFDQDLMTGITEEAELLKKEIVELYYQYREEHILKPGEIILIDNRRAVHGRSPFQAKFDGTDRFIIRSFVTLDYNASLFARKNGSRMIAAKYS